MKVDLDFTNVKSSKKIRIPEGDYLAKVKSVKKVKASTGSPMLVMDFMILNGKGAEGKTIQDNHVLTENALWTLRNMLEAMGYEVPATKMKFDDKMVRGKKVGITVIDGDEYKGRISSEIADYIAPSVVGNKVTAEEADEDEDSDDGMEFEDSDDGDEEFEEDDTSDDSDDEDSDDDSDDGDFTFEDDDEEEDEEEEVALSFDEDDVNGAKAAELKTYIKEAQEAGFEFDLPAKPKAKDVREALLGLFAEDEEDDDEMEDFDLDDVE